VIVKAEVQELSAVDQLPRKPEILLGRRRISRGMIVDENQRGCPSPKRRPQYFSRVHERSRLGARRDQCVHQVVILGIQEDDPEMLLVVIGSPEEITGKQGDRLW
jgi:hypothetical protein